MEYCYASGLEKTLCKWDIYVPLVTKGLGNKNSNMYINNINQNVVNLPVGWVAH